MDSRKLVETFAQVGQFGWFLQPGSLKEWIESVLSTPIYDTWANHKNLHIFPLDSQHFILNFSHELILGQGHSCLIISLLIECVFDGLLLYLHFLLLVVFFVFFALLSRLRFFGLRLSRLFCIFYIFGRRRWRILLDLPGRITPDHNIRDQYKYLVIFEWFGHSLDGEVYVRQLSLVEAIYIHLALLYSFLPKELRFFAFEDFLDAGWLLWYWGANSAHMDRVFGGFFDQFSEEGLSEGRV